jgi:SAM-dependent methyltransferase
LSNTDEAWESWGARDPYFGVLTDPKYRSATLTEAAKEEFFASGRSHVHYLSETIRQYVLPSFTPRRSLDFGCGVGRVLLPLSELCDEAVGVDVSPSMLVEARRNCEQRGRHNVRLVPSDDTLSEVEGRFDLVHSCIVLQHVEIPRGRALFAELVSRIEPGGVGALHVTHAWDVHAASYGQPPAASAAPVPLDPTRDALASARERLRALLAADAGGATPPQADPEMQMNYYNLSELMFILQRQGVRRVHSEFTDHGGALGIFMFFQKPVAPAPA